MLQAAKKKSRKLTDHRKQLLPRPLISNVIVRADKGLSALVKFFLTRRELWEMIGRGEVDFFDLLQLVRDFCTEKIIKEKKKRMVKF